MPDDVGGLPSPNGEGPNSEDLGAADEAFASVVLDEAFIEAAEVHEPTAAERILYAALERAESEAELEAEAGGEIGFYRDPDLDPGSSDGLAGFESGGGQAGFLGEGPDGEDEGDDEGRFDSSDYTRYLADLPDGEYDDQAEQAEQDELAFGGPYPPYGGGYGGVVIPGSGGAVGPGPAHAEAAAGWRPVRWQRPVACVLAMVMGISVIAFALIAIQRAGSGGSRLPGPTPPAPTEPTEPEGPDDEGTTVEADFSDGDGSR
ncbi:SCO2584 family spore wall biosynthesis protein [Streptomyces mayteni]